MEKYGLQLRKKLLCGICCPYALENQIECRLLNTLSRNYSNRETKEITNSQGGREVIDYHLVIYSLPLTLVSKFELFFKRTVGERQNSEEIGSLADNNGMNEN